jgi:hypothetical protein
VWLILPAIASTFLLQYTIQGWCPPVSILRNFGFRTRQEIDLEKCALKALRGGFDKVSSQYSKRASMADIEHALKGIDFPKNKNEIVRYAQEHNASNDIIANIKELPDMTYNNAVDVAQEFRGKHLNIKSG